jgi:hypothetical protein
METEITEHRFHEKLGWRVVPNIHTGPEDMVGGGVEAPHQQELKASIMLLRHQQPRIDGNDLGALDLDPCSVGMNRVDEVIP